MRLIYADGAKLYVPLERLDLVQSYRAVEAPSPFSTSSAARRGRPQGRVRKSVEDMADKLLKLYAERKAGEGSPFRRTRVSR